ncbi:MAG: PEP-CTERM sorting domain-containing protein [Verrucomicrobiaceae bacterium]
MKSTLGLSALLVTVLLPSQGAVIAQHSSEFNATTPGAGWSYLWNPTGFDVGDSANYQALAANGTTRVTVGGAATGNSGPTNAEFLNIAGTSVHPGNGPDGSGTDAFDHAAIIGYTVQAGEAGNLSIINSNANRNGQFGGGDGTGISVYLGDVLINSVLVPKATDGSTPGTASFNFSIGNVAEGETIYIAVTPLGHPGQDGLSSFDFQIDSAAIPEPSSALILSVAGLGLIGRRKRS